MCSFKGEVARADLSVWLSGYGRCHTIVNVMPPS